MKYNEAEIMGDIVLLWLITIVMSIVANFTYNSLIFITISIIISTNILLNKEEGRRNG